MRILLFTGKGGVGKSTMAASTAAHGAAAGMRTLVISTDTAHSLADAFGVQIGAEPTAVATNLWVAHVETQQRFEESWGEVEGYLKVIMEAAGVDAITSQELMVVPGAEEVMALLEVRRHADSGRWDLLVVDCAPTAETLRLLALPEALNWYMERLFPTQRRLVKTLRPVLAKVAGMPMPEDAVFGAIERLHAQMAQVRELLASAQTRVRIVMTPERIVVAEARRSWTSLALFGYRVDGVVVNRIFPHENADPWRERWVHAQREVLAEIEHSFPGLALWRSTYQGSEPIGVDALRETGAAIYAAASPFDVAVGVAPFRVIEQPTGFWLEIDLPGVASGEIEVGRSGDELVLTVGGYRRLLTMPAAAARLRVVGAKLIDLDVTTTSGPHDRPEPAESAEPLLRRVLRVTLSGPA